jgi:hypothetical protein
VLLSSYFNLLEEDIYWQVDFVPAKAVCPGKKTAADISFLLEIVTQGIG